MKPIKFPARLLVTLAALSLAALVAWQLWVYYMEDPWTRDGTIRADTVDLAPDVSSPVVSVFVQDNQPVHIGDPLFEIDPARFKLAQAQADANAAKTKAAMQDAERTASRYASLSNNAASGQSRDQSSSVAVEAQADYAQAQANQAIAALNLERTTVRATVNGIVTNVSLRPGDYATAGTPVIAIVDTDSLYVDGYFEETKLGRIAVGDPARVTLLDGAPPLTGHVTGIAAAITDAERTASPNLLANVNPTFNWVRLARRVPVRIALDHVPPHTILVAGMTCTVAISH